MLFTRDLNPGQLQTLLREVSEGPRQSILSRLPGHSGEKGWVATGEDSNGSLKLRDPSSR